MTRNDAIIKFYHLFSFPVYHLPVCVCVCFSLQGSVMCVLGWSLFSVTCLISLIPQFVALVFNQSSSLHESPACVWVFVPSASECLFWVFQLFSITLVCMSLTGHRRETHEGEDAQKPRKMVVFMARKNKQCQTGTQSNLYTHDHHGLCYKWCTGCWLPVLWLFLMSLCLQDSVSSGSACAAGDETIKNRFRSDGSIIRFHLKLYCSL